MENEKKLDVLLKRLLTKTINLIDILLIISIGMIIVNNI